MWHTPKLHCSSTRQEQVRCTAMPCRIEPCSDQLPPPVVCSCFMPLGHRQCHVNTQRLDQARCDSMAKVSCDDMTLPVIPQDLARANQAPRNVLQFEQNL